jgi:hypothetical protein
VCVRVCVRVCVCVYVCVCVSDPQAATEASFVSFDALDEFRYRFDGGIPLRWTMYRGPKDVYDKLAAVNAMLEQEKHKYMQELADDQAQFNETLNQIDEQVKSFSQHTDITRVAVISAQVKKIRKMIQEAGDKARQINAREGLFSADATEYDRLSQMTKAFEPYAKCAPARGVCSHAALFHTWSCVRAHQSVGDGRQLAEVARGVADAAIHLPRLREVGAGPRDVHEEHVPRAEGI